MSDGYDEVNGIESFENIPGKRRYKMTSLLKIEGIGDTYAVKLAEAGILTTQALLKEGATTKGRKGLSNLTGISEKLILEWVNHADLFRIKGVGEEYSDLLEAAGVDTVVELAQRNPENLYKKLVAVNNVKDLVRKVPGESQVKSWVNQAKELPRIITY
jgi:predicted flap endonuclease-1-like 5' DNA nuclease